MEAVLSFLESLHFHPVVFVGQLILFTLFHFAMRVLIYDSLIRARDGRDGRIGGQLAQAEAAAANAQALKQRYDEEIKEQRLQLAHQLKEAIAQAEKEANATLQQARDEAGKVVDEANAKLNEEERELRSGMEREAGKLALAVSQQVVRNSLKQDAQERVLAQLKG